MQLLKANILTDFYQKLSDLEERNEQNVSYRIDNSLENNFDKTLKELNICLKKCLNDTEAFYSSLQTGASLKDKGMISNLYKKLDQFKKAMESVTNKIVEESFEQSFIQTDQSYMARDSLIIQGKEPGGNP